MTEPLTPAGLDLRDFPYMPLDVARIRDSSLATKAGAEEFRAAVILWCAAWHQVPAASLPDDDQELAWLAGFGRDLKKWRKIRTGALRHFVKCTDGRLYHPVIAEKAIEAMSKREAYRQRTANATATRLARQAERDAQRNVQHNEHDEQRNEGDTSERNVHQVKDKGRLSEAKLSEVKVDNLSSAQPYDPRESNARLRLEILEFWLREAAGWQRETAPGLLVTGPIDELIQAGASPELDVFPTVRAKAPQVRSRKSWAFFVDPIKEATARRLDARKPISINGSAHSAASRKDWERRLLSARKRKMWDSINWGPMPKQPGCRVPNDCLQPSDGEGWAPTWDAAA